MVRFDIKIHEAQMVQALAQVLDRRVPHHVHGLPAAGFNLGQVSLGEQVPGGAALLGLVLKVKPFGS